MSRWQNVLKETVKVTAPNAFVCIHKWSWSVRRLLWVKALILVALVLFTCIIIYPIQNKEVYLFKDGLLPSSASTTVSFIPLWPEFKSYMPGLPVVIGASSYNIKINNLNNVYDWYYGLTLSTHDPIFPYIEKNINLSPGTADDNRLFVVEPRQHYIIKNIPVSIPLIDHYGIMITCGRSIRDNCPRTLMTSVDDPAWKNLSIVAAPNVSLSSLCFQVFLIFIFWMVFINSFLEFFRHHK